MFHVVRVAVTFSVIVICLQFASPVAYGDDGEFNWLRDETWRLFQAGKYKEMERLAIRMRQLAEGPLADQPALTAGALGRQSLSLNGQGRYAEAEALCKRGASDS